MKIINKNRRNKELKAVELNELYDFFDDDTIGVLDNYETNDAETIDYDALERGEIPAVVVDDERVEGLLVDNIEEDLVEPEGLIEEPQGEIAIEGEDVPDFVNAQEAMQWAIDNNRVVKIFYITSGKSRNIIGPYLKREQPGRGAGKEIYRIVEPHHMFMAKNGHMILVTYDRSVRKIRAFRIENIIEYNFTKNRKTKEPQYFRPRMRVMPNSGKGIKAMDNIKNELNKIAIQLETEGMKKSASVVKDAISAVDDIKTAQYVGIQGYWLRNRRCWDNCYRHKRTTQPDTPAQEVWMECWDEYKKSINNDKSGWEKYAQKEDEKLNEEGKKEWKKIFISKVEDKVKKELSIPEAIYASIEEESQKYDDKIIEESSNLMTIAETLVDNGYKEIGDKLAKVVEGILKESDFFVSNDKIKEAQFTGTSPGGFWRGLVTPFRRGKEKVRDWWTGTGRKEDVVKKIQDVVNRANVLLKTLNLSRGATQANSEKRIIIEAGKGTKIVLGQFLPEERQEANIMEEIAKKEDQKRKERKQRAKQREDSKITSTPVETPVSPIVKDIPPMAQPGYEGLPQEYNRFFNDTSKLITELMGYAAKGDPEIAAYARGALPLLQDFIGKSNEQRKEPDPMAKREFLRNSLQKLTTGLQGVLSGQSSILDTNLGDVGLSSQQGIGGQPSQQGMGGYTATKDQQTPISQYKYQLTGNMKQDVPVVRFDPEMLTYLDNVVNVVKNVTLQKKVI